MTTDLDRVAEAARLLYGASSWQRGLARDLRNRHGGPMHHRTVQSWFERASIPDDIWPQVQALVRRRIADLRAYAGRA